MEEELDYNDRTNKKYQDSDDYKTSNNVLPTCDQCK